MKKIIATDKAPSAVGPYSQAVEVNGVVYTSGVIGIDPADGLLKGDVYEQAERALCSLEQVLLAAGASMEDVVKTTVFMKDISAFGGVNEIYAKHFPEPYPARSCVEVAALPKGCLVEIEAVAVKK